MFLPSKQEARVQITVGENRLWKKNITISLFWETTLHPQNMGFKFSDA